MKYEKILTVPDPRLEQVCEEVEQVDAEIKEIALDMIELMNKSNGIGLAASQVGFMKRLFVMKQGNKPIVLINPTLKRHTGVQVNEEGCLSIPNQRIAVMRPRKAELEALTLDGKLSLFNVSGIEAACALHELDHLDGITILQRNRHHLAIPGALPPISKIVVKL